MKNVLIVTGYPRRAGHSGHAGSRWPAPGCRGTGDGVGLVQPDPFSDRRVWRLIDRCAALLRLLP
jgi:hypothetical protein